MKPLIPDERYAHITLTPTEKRIINLFDFWDYLDVYGYRKHITKKPSAFKPYFEKYECCTSKEKLKVMKFAKGEKTKHLIYSRDQSNGVICEQLRRVQRKSPCGWLRLMVAMRHKNGQESSGRMGIKAKSES